MDTSTLNQDKIVKEKDFENEEKNKVVSVEDSPLKKFLVEYTGEQVEPEDGNVTVEMILETIAKEFPELLLIMAEENFFAGYQQALKDMDNLKSEDDG